MLRVRSRHQLTDILALGDALAFEDALPDGFAALDGALAAGFAAFGGGLAAAGFFEMRPSGLWWDFCPDRQGMLPLALLKH